VKFFPGYQTPLAVRGFTQTTAERQTRKNRRPNLRDLLLDLRARNAARFAHRWAAQRPCEQRINARPSSTRRMRHRSSRTPLRPPPTTYRPALELGKAVCRLPLLLPTYAPSTMVRLRLCPITHPFSERTASTIRPSRSSSSTRQSQSDRNPPVAQSILISSSINMPVRCPDCQKSRACALHTAPSPADLHTTCPQARRADVSTAAYA
jgi:hypothetical protein